MKQSLISHSCLVLTDLRRNRSDPEDDHRKRDNRPSKNDQLLITVHRPQLFHLTLLLIPLPPKKLFDIIITKVLWAKTAKQEMNSDSIAKF